MNGKTTKIVAAFPGTGKSYFHRKNPHIVLDSDSSLFSWTLTESGEKVRNPDFPSNYIKHIKDSIGAVDFILVSTHEEVRRALRENCLFFYLVYPDKDAKDIYLQRYVDRGSNEGFIKLLDTNWEKWIKECQMEQGCEHLILHGNGFLEHLIGGSI